MENQNTDTTPEQNENTEVQTPVINDEAVLAYFRENGREVESLDTLFAVPEPTVETKEVDPWEGVLDDEDRAYLNYKKETGRTRKEFEMLQTNLDDVSPLQFAREQVLKETGMKLSTQEINEYLETKLGINDIENLTTTELIELGKYGKSVKDARKEEQNKYKQPIPKQEEPIKPNGNQDEIVQLANGTFMKKSDYEVALKHQENHVKMVLESVGKLASATFSVSIDENGEPKELNYNYDYSDEDRSGTAAIVSDLPKYIQDTYQSDQGFNHTQFSEDVFWMKPKNRVHVISHIVDKVRAEAIEGVMKERGNVNFQNQNQNLSNKEKPRVVYKNINEI